MSFDVLQEKIIAKKNPTVAGLDPKPEQIPSEERGRAFGHREFLIAREHRRERRFARAVRPHDGMHLAGFHFEVDAPQNLFAVDRRMQIFYT